MSDFNAAKGGMVPGGLALVVNDRVQPEAVGKIVELVRFCNEGDWHENPVHYGYLESLQFGGGTAWMVVAEGLVSCANPAKEDHGWSFYDSRDLVPITPEPDPLQVQTEKEQLV